MLRDAVKKIFGDKKNGSGRRSGRASLADLLRWVRGGDEVQTFLSLFDRESLEGTTTVKAKRPSSKRGPDVKKSHSERSPEMLMAEIEVRTDLVWGLVVTGAVRGAKDQATQNETAKKARELAEAAASEEARIEAEKRAAEAEAEAQRLAAEAEAKAQDASATRLAACVRGRNSRREIDAQKRPLRD